MKAPLNIRLQTPEKPARLAMPWVAVVLSLLLSACANFSSLQTGRTLPPETSRLTFAGGFFQSSEYEAQLANLAGSSPNLRFPYAEFSYRKHLREDWDWGARITFLGTISGDVKRQFIDWGPFASAIGFGLGYVLLPGSIPQDPNAAGGTADRLKGVLHYFDATVPWYLSFDFNDVWSIYATPRILFRYVYGKLSQGSSTLAGSAFGVKIGAKMGVFLEGSYLQRIDRGGLAPSIQISGAFFFTNGPSLGISTVSLKRSRAIAPIGTLLETRVQQGQLVVSHPHARQWALYETLCAKEGDHAYACGIVVRTDSQKATLKLVYRKGDVALGSPVFSRESRYQEQRSPDAEGTDEGVESDVDAEVW